MATPTHPSLSELVQDLGLLVGGHGCPVALAAGVEGLARHTWRKLVAQEGRQHHDHVDALSKDDRPKGVPYTPPLLPRASPFLRPATSAPPYYLLTSLRRGATYSHMHTLIRTESSIAHLKLLVLLGKYPKNPLKPKKI